MKTILVATDLSIRSDRALRRAVRLAGASGGEVHAIHVIDECLPTDVSEPLRDTAQRRLERFVDSLKSDVAVRCDTVFGDPLLVIPEEARSRQADLVVLGLHRPRPFFDGLRETTMERLLRLVHLPVLLVRDTADHDYERVLAPVSFSPACAAALRAARAIAPEARFSLLHAVYLPFAGLTGERPGGPMDRELTAEAAAACKHWRAAEDLPAGVDDITYVSGGLNAVIERQIAQLKPHLIALGAHTRGPIALHPLGSFAASLVRDPPADLLVARP